MKDEAINFYLLNFIDKQKEKEFIENYDGENRIFYRIGIYLSCLAWFIWYTGIYYSHYQVFANALAVLLIVLLIPFIVVVILSFYKKYSTLTHNITAFCNFAAASVCIYVAVYLSEDITFLVSGVICISFFCYFILRIRFKVSLIITLGYAIIAQLCVISSGNFNNNQIVSSSSGIYLGFFIAMISGYFFERTNRKIFIQNNVIKDQQNELIIERNKIKLSLEELKSTQAQLILSEKMASLGELTAGIAHEIQNPLNFVNNFSEVSVELVGEIQDIRRKTQDEMREARSEIRDEGRELEDEILEDIKQNLEKINHHGKRADAIVKGMLEHSRTSTGEKVLTDINTLAEEYLRLSYHGMRAKDKSFNAEFITDFDRKLPKINVVPQDIGRVLLNVINNAFQAVVGTGHALSLQPMVTISTKTLGDKIEISISDNGPGIPEAIKDKIFQPFFTTKPTGQGTGLGLSLSYDIVKAHGGVLNVKTKEGEGTEFLIILPYL